MFECLFISDSHSSVSAADSVPRNHEDNFQLVNVKRDHLSVFLVERPENHRRHTRVQKYSSVVAPLEIHLELRRLAPRPFKEIQLRICKAAESVDTHHEMGEQEAVRQMERYDLDLLLLVPVSGSSALFSLPSPSHGTRYPGHHAIKYGPDL